MANPIRNIKRMEVSDEEIQQQNLAEVLEAVSENKEAILKGIDLLATVDETGGLDIIDAFIKHREVALEKIINEMNKDKYASSIENISKLFIAMGSIQVDELQAIINKVNEGMKEAQTVSEDENTSYMGILKALKDPEVNRSITMLLQFLRVMGKN